MKNILLLPLIISFWVIEAQARTLVIDVHGMTCAFCVDSLQRKFSRLPSVHQVDISLKHKQVRLETDQNTPDLDTVRQTVLDAGFTPLEIREQ